MTYALLTAFVAVNVLYVLHLERKDRRHDSQVNRLLQRIQDPERAVLEHAEIKVPDGPLYTNEWAEDQAHLEALLRDDE